MIKSIILEGINGSGKSTLGGKLSEVLDLPYEHAGPTPGSDEGRLLACLNQLDMLKKGVILDRVTPISEPVYNDIDDQNKWMLDMFLNRMLDHAIVVVCTGEGRYIEKEYYPNGHFKHIRENMDQIKDRYNRILRRINFYTYDWRTKSIMELIQEIQKNELRRKDGL